MPDTESLHVIRQLYGWRLQIGNEPPSGWLPPGTVEPLPTPGREVIVDVRIEEDSHGYLLICESQDATYGWDSWHETLEDTEGQAERYLGISTTDWQPSAR